MPAIYKEIINAQITDASGAIAHTCPAGVREKVVAAAICNTETATPYTFNAYKVPSGGSAGASTKIINTRTVQGGETYPGYHLIGQVLEPGDILDFDASTTLKLNCIVSVVELP
jgi:hypothetical protein